MNNTKTYSFASFNYVDSDVHIDTDTIFFRGIDKVVQPKDVLRPGIPMFLGPLEIAQDYGHVYKIRTTRRHKLLDFRKLRKIS